MLLYCGVRDVYLIVPKALNTRSATVKPITRRDLPFFAPHVCNPLDVQGDITITVKTQNNDAWESLYFET